MVAQPEFQPVSFLTLERGTPVVDRYGRPVGEVVKVLVHSCGSFDGIIVRTRAGRRFVDAPEVRRVSRGAVTLGVAAADVEEPGASGLRHGVPMARHDRTAVTEADRDAAIEALKAAYVADELSAEELGDRVAGVHLAETLTQIDAALDLR